METHSPRVRSKTATPYARHRLLKLEIVQQVSTFGKKGHNNYRLRKGTRRIQL